MDLDPLSIITPARVKVILIPVGHVRQSRFEGFVQRLQQVNVVRLGDVSPDSRPHRSMALLFHVPYHLLTITTAMFSPLAFPEGLVLYDLSTSLPPPSHLALSPFEIYREPWVVIGLADGINAVSDATQDKEAKRLDDLVAKDASKVNELRSLVTTLEDLIDDFPKALVHQILVFDHDGTSLPERIYPVPTPSKSKTTTIKTVMCDLTSRLLAEMSTYAKSLQGLHTLDSPMIPSGTGKLNGVASALPAHMNEISRTSSSRLASQGGDTTRSEHRMSVPAKFPSVPSSGISTPDSRPASPSNGARTPPTSLNEISGSASFPSPPKSTGHDRADSRSGGKASGFGADSLGERDRTKGKGRIGIAIGALYLLAGRWPDAVKELVQNAAVARNSSDYLWHAKAMDCVLVCLLMYAWAGMDFRVSFHHIDESNSYTQNFSRWMAAEASRFLKTFFLARRGQARAAQSHPSIRPRTACRIWV